MYSTTHQFAQCVVDQSVPLQRGFSGELRRNNHQAIVSAPAGAGVAGMLLGFVDKFQSQRGKECQSFVQQGFDFCHAGNAFLNGLMVTVA